MQIFNCLDNSLTPPSPPPNSDASSDMSADEVLRIGEHLAALRMSAAQQIAENINSKRAPLK
jgi:hypothetical protein